MAGQSCAGVAEVVFDVCKPPGLGHLLLAAAVGLKAGKPRALLCAQLGEPGVLQKHGLMAPASQQLNCVFPFNSCQPNLN